MGQKDMSVRSGNEIEGREQTHDLFIRPAVDMTVQAKGKSYLSAEPIQREFLPGNFYRKFQLADIFDPEKISAEMKNGVLTLRVPKSEAAKPRHIEITAS
jgi:HSP20 family molecular chaperone IbpA